MMNFIKSALTDETSEQSLQEAYVNEQKIFHGAKAFAFVNDY